MSCNRPNCPHCVEPLFDDLKAEEAGIDVSLPEFLWGAEKKPLVGMDPEDVYSTEWMELEVSSEVARAAARLKCRVYVDLDEFGIFIPKVS